MASIPTPSRPARKQGHWRLWLLLFLLLIVLPASLLAAWTWITLHYAYSKGERAGYVQKISQKGWLCKTWEGELAITAFPGTAPQIFLFSVRDNAVAEQIQRVAGQQVALTYEQHKGVPSSCFAETQYFITSVRPVNPAK